MAGTLAQAQLKKYGKSASKMSALDIAVLGKHLEQKESGEGEITSVQMDADDQDWNQMVEEAKGGGIRSWFASKVDFSLNGTRFKGKVGFPVKAGVMPLFDGAAIDLNSSKMKAQKPKKAQADPIQGDPAGYKNWITGTGGMLVLAPVGMDNVVPVRMDKLTVTERGLTGQAGKQMEFRKGNVSVKASGMILKRDKVELVDSTEIEHGETEVESRRSAAITGRGLVLGPKEESNAQVSVSQAAESTEEEPVASSSQNTSSQSTSSQDTSSQGAPADKQPAKEQKRNDVEHITAGPGIMAKLQDTVVEKATELLSNDISFGGDDDDDDDDQKEDKSIADKAKDVAKDMGKNIVGDVFSSILGGDDKKEDDKKDDDEDEKNEFKLSGKVNLSEGSFSLNAEYGKKEEEEDDPLVKQIAQGAQKKVEDTVSSAIVDLVHGNPGDAGQRFVEVGSSVKDIAESTVNNVKEGKLTENLKKLPDALKRYLTTEVTEEGVKDDVTKAASEMVPLDDIKKLLGMDGDNEEKEDNEQGIDGDIPLVSIPIVIPALMFSVTLSPDFKYQFYANVSGENLRALYQDLLGLEKKDEDSGVALLKFKAGLKTSLGLEAKAGIEEGIPFLIQGFQGIKASTKLGGALGEADEAVEAAAELPVERKKNGKFGLANQDIKAGLRGAFSLTGSVGAEVSLNSKLFVWSKTLAEVQFAQWRLATIGLNLGLTKKAGSSGLFGGWNMDEASVSVKGPSVGLGKAFLEKNTPEKKYGLTTPDVSETKEYRDLRENFDDALKLLERFASPQAGEALAIPSDASATGLTDTVVNMETVLNRFVNLWARLQNELEVVQKQLDQYVTSGGYQRSEENARKKIMLHAGRLGGLSAWTPQMKDEKGKNVSVEDYYKSLSGSPGHGFHRALRQKAHDRASTFENLANYEKKRYLEVTKKSTERIELLKKMMADGVSTNEQITKAYKDKGGSKVFDHKAQFVGSADDIVAFEVGEMEKRQKAAREHLTKAYEFSVSKDVKNAQEKAEKQAKKSGKTDDEIKKLKEEAGLSQFFKLYAKSLDKTQALKYGSIDYLLSYEQERLEHYGAKNADYQTYQKLKSGTSSTDSQSAADKEKKKKEMEENLFRTATIEDLIAFERTKNKGNVGEILESYLSDSSKQQMTDANVNAQMLLDSVFADPKNPKKSLRKDAIKKFKERYVKRKSEEDLPFLTIELLLNYVMNRMQKAKSQDAKNKLSEEYSYLQRARIVVETTDPEKMAEEETKQIKQYFNHFEGVQDQYRSDVSEGREVNLKLMQDVFASDEGNERLSKLKEMSEGGNLNIEVLKAYLKMSGTKEKELSEYLRKKQGGADLSAEQIERYYVSRMTDNGDISNHFVRLTKLQQLAASGVTYSKMIEEYEKMGGTDGYADYVRENIADGILYGKDMSRGMTIEDVLKYEQDRVLEAGALNQKLIEYVESNKKKMDYQDLLAGYEKQSKENNMGAVRKLVDKYVTDLSSDYEKSKKDEVLSPQNLLDFEIADRERIGSKHRDRLKELFGVEVLPDNLDDLVIPADEEVKEERRKAYIEQSKRYEKDQSVRQAEAEELEKMSSTDEALFAEMMLYEKERKDYYETEFRELVNVHQQILDREQVLRDEISISSSVAYNIGQIKEHPDQVFGKIEEFRKAVSQIEHSDEEEKNAQQQQRRLVEAAKQQQALAEKMAVGEDEAEAV